MNAFRRGPDRIRTDVQAFAELCIATLPRDRVVGCEYTKGTRIWGWIMAFAPEVTLPSRANPALTP